MQIEERRRRFGSFEESASLKIVPSLAMPHRGVGNALKQMNALDDQP